MTNPNIPKPLTTKANPSRCPNCLNQVWSAVVDGMPTRCDPKPLDVVEEIMARSHRITIYQTRPEAGGGFTLQVRWPEHIRHSNPDYILAEHRCSQHPGDVLTDLYPPKSDVNLPERPEY